MGYPYLAELARGPLLALFPAEGLTLPQAMVVVFGGPAVLLLIIVSHEAGHALAGSYAGLRFEMVAAGPVLLRTVDSGRGLALGINRQPSLMAGYSVCLPPPEMNRLDLRRGMLWHISGGPLASLMVGAGSVGIALLMPASSGWGSVVRALLLLMGFGSLMVGLVTALPTGGRSMLNDGARWLQLKRGGVKANRDLALLTTSSRAMAGDAPHTWDGDLLQVASQLCDSSLFEFWTLRYHWLHLWDSGDLVQASATLERALRVAAGQDPGVRHLASLDGTRFCLWACSAPDIAREWLECAPHGDAALAEDPEAGVARLFKVRAAAAASRAPAAD